MTSNVNSMIAQRQQAVARHWDAFVRTGSLYLGEVIGRGDAKLAPCFVPWSPAVAIASERLLSAAGYHRRHGHLPRLTGWSAVPGSAYAKQTKAARLIVRRRGKFFTVEMPGQVLVFAFGSMPIVTHMPEAAKYLAEYCFGAQLSGLRWIAHLPEAIRCG